MFFKRTATTVRLGERFVKAGDPAGLAWEVVRVWTTAVGIPHAQIVNNYEEKRIISVSALTDHHFFGPVQSAAA